MISRAAFALQMSAAGFFIFMNMLHKTFNTQLVDYVNNVKLNELSDDIGPIYYYKSCKAIHLN